MPDERTERYLEGITFEWNDIDFSGTAQARKLPAPPLEKPHDSTKPLVRLPPIDAIERPGLSLMDAVLGRKSRRKFSAEALLLSELALLLFCTQGVKTHNEKRSMRTVPSGGARHAFETYLYLERVAGIEPGLYRYLALEHALVLEREIDDPAKASLDEALNGQLYGAAAYFIWTAVPERMAWRYSFATAKLLALDAGHLCQNLYLACEAIGCGTCAIGAYDQARMDAFLGLDGREEFAIYMAPVGKIDTNK